LAAPFRSGAKTFSAAVGGFRSWDPQSPREDGGSPDGFDSIALDYLMRHKAPVVPLLISKIEAATWMVHSFTPLQKAETFTEVDPRAARVIGYHRYQDEKSVAARLEQPQALTIPRRSLARLGGSSPQFGR